MLCTSVEFDQILSKYLALLPQRETIPDINGFVQRNERVSYAVYHFGAYYEEKQEKCQTITYELEFNAYLNSLSFNIYSKRFYRFICSGVPGSLKLDVYRHLLCASCDNDCSATYRQLLEKPYEQSILTYIAKDLDRTMPARYFLRFSEVQTQLFRVLSAYAAYSELKYMQGMSFPAAFLLYFADEETTFALFSGMMRKIGEVFDIRSGLQHAVALLRQKVSYQLPELFEYLERMQIDFTMFAPYWFMAVFSKSTPYRLFERIFDLVAYKGQEAMIAVALQLLTIATRGAIFRHSFAPDDPYHVDEFYRFYDRLESKERRAGISCLGMTNSDCLDWIQNVGRSIRDIDYFIYETMALLE